MTSQELDFRRLISSQSLSIVDKATQGEGWREAKSGLVKAFLQESLREVDFNEESSRQFEELGEFIRLLISFFDKNAEGELEKFLENNQTKLVKAFNQSVAGGDPYSACRAARELFVLGELQIELGRTKLVEKIVDELSQGISHLRTNTDGEYLNNIVDREISLRNRLNVSIFSDGDSKNYIEFCESKKQLVLHGDLARIVSQIKASNVFRTSGINEELVIDASDVTVSTEGATQFLSLLLDNLSDRKIVFKASQLTEILRYTDEIEDAAFLVFEDYDAA